MKIALAALDFKMQEGGMITLENLRMENSALKALQSEIFLQMSELHKKVRGEKQGANTSQKSASLVLRARIKSNGSRS
jgi:hypothetical protein